jgi:hypothetical protein
MGTATISINVLRSTDWRLFGLDPRNARIPRNRMERSKKDAKGMPHAAECRSQGDKQQQQQHQGGAPRSHRGYARKCLRQDSAIR